MVSARMSLHLTIGALAVGLVIVLVNNTNVVPIGLTSYATFDWWGQGLKWWVLPIIYTMLAVYAPGVLLRYWTNWMYVVVSVFGLFGLLMLVRIVVLFPIAYLLYCCAVGLPSVPPHWGHDVARGSSLFWLSRVNDISLLHILAVIAAACILLGFYYLILLPFVRVRSTTLVVLLIINAIAQQAVYAIGKPEYLSLIPFFLVGLSTVIAHMLEGSSTKHIQRLRKP